MQKEKDIEAIVRSFAPATLLGKKYLREQLEKLPPLIIQHIRESTAVAAV